MEALPLYALLWLLPFLLVLLLPWVVRKVRGPGPEPRMTDANFLVKMRLRNHMVDSLYMFPLMLLGGMGNLAMGYEDRSWHLLFGGFLLGLALAHAGRFLTSRQYVNILKKEEERAS